MVVSEIWSLCIYLMQSISWIDFVAFFFFSQVKSEKNRIFSINPFAAIRRHWRPPHFLPDSAIRCQWRLNKKILKIGLGEAGN